MDKQSERNQSRNHSFATVKSAGPKNEHSGSSLTPSSQVTFSLQMLTQLHVKLTKLHVTYMFVCSMYMRYR